MKKLPIIRINLLILITSIFFFLPLTSHAFIPFPNQIDTIQERVNVQTVLNTVMYPSPNLKLDGVLGRKSIQAIQAFQESMWLTPDGKVGPITRVALENSQANSYTQTYNPPSSYTPTSSCSSGALFDTQTGIPCTSPYTSSLNISRTLKLTVPRMTGDDIKELQTYLNSHGYNTGNPDGVYGSGTQQAIIKFQQLNNLTPDGSLGPKTISYINQLSTNNTTTTNTFTSGCLSTSGLNTITGLPCNTNVYNLPQGCFSSSGFSILSGTPCSTKSITTVTDGDLSNVNKTTPDTTKPKVSSFSIPSTSTSLTVATYYIATDTVGVTGYLITESSTTPTSGWLTYKPSSYVFSSQGSKILYAWARDAAGNVSTPVLATVIITIPPDATATTFTLSGPSSGNVNSQSSNFTITPNNLYTGTITITPTGLSSITKTFSNSSSSQTFTITPTSAGTITLSPSNNGGLTNPSVFTYTVNAVITVPSAPTSVTTTAGNASATVSFTAPSSNGGSTITYYTVTSSPGSITKTGTSSPITVTGLTNNTSYTFTVKATNTIGSSSSSSASNSVTPTLSTDTIKPTVDAFTIPTTATSLTIPINTFTASDNVGVTSYLVTETSTTPSAGSGSWSTTKPTSHTFGSILGAYKYNFTQTLREGITNEEVKQLQMYLNNHGYLISTSGSGSTDKETTYFGSLTKQALIKFQQANKLDADGIVGQNTRMILNK